MELASTGPMLVLTFIRLAVLAIIPELPLLLLPVMPAELDLVDMELLLPAELGEVLLPHAASSNAGMASTAGVHLR